jgi:dTDP-4-dehydrorhamnose reductase
VQEIKPDLIVNAAAYTAVDKAEEEEVLATTINGTAVGVLAEQAKRRNALLVHYSTDYVFDGTKSTPYTEEDEPNPINAYGRSKLAGEQAVREVGGEHLIFRTSWVYAVRGSNFIKTILRLASERDELKVIADQLGAPTSAEFIADITALCLYRQVHGNVFAEEMVGTYHLAPTGETSWHGLAEYVIAEAQHYGFKLRTASENVCPVSSTEYQLPAQRPVNSQLVTQKLADVLGVRLPVWQDSVDRMLSEMLAGK